MLYTAATVLSIPLNKEKENSQVNKLGVISNERSHVRNSEAVNLILIHRPANRKQESYQSVKFPCYLVGLFLTNNRKWSSSNKDYFYKIVILWFQAFFEEFHASKQTAFCRSLQV